MPASPLAAQGLGQTALLKPLAALAGWSFVMEAWMYATRIPALSKYGVNTDRPDTVKEEMNTKVPMHIRQIADNYNHLHEQPTVFYAVTLALAILGDNSPYTLGAAWGYVGSRIAHSLFQSLVNKVMIRFSIFISSSLVAAGITGRLAQLLLEH